MKILIVDDEAGTRLMVATAVERLGHRALQAADGDEGWAAFELHRPEVVITDWAMPGLDGTQLIARIRAADGDYAYIMLLSGRVDEGASREAMRAGADDVLSKPPDPAELERGLIAAERITTMHRRMRDDARRDPLTGAGQPAAGSTRTWRRCARASRATATRTASPWSGSSPAATTRCCAPARRWPRRSAPATCSTGRARRSSSSCCRSRGWTPRTSRPTRLRGAAQAAAPPGTTVSVGMVTTEAEPEPAALLDARRGGDWARSRQSGGIAGHDPAAAAGCGCWSPTTTPCRG